MDWLRPMLTKLMNWLIYDMARTLDQIKHMPSPRVF